MQRQGAHSAQVLRYILPGNAVPTCSPPDENTVFIFERHGKAVYLGLYNIAVLMAQNAVHTLPKGEKLLNGKNVSQAFQRHLMHHRLKF